MNKAELTAEVAERLTGTDPDARRYVDAVFDAIMRHVAAGDRVQILGFGTFDSVERAARTGRNPRTGATIQVPASVTPRFHAGQTFRTQVTGGTAAPAPVAEAAAEAEVKQGAAKPAKAKKAKGAVKTAKAEKKKAAKPAAKKVAKAEETKPTKTPKVAKKLAKKPEKATKSKAGKK